MPSASTAPAPPSVDQLSTLRVRFSTWRDAPPAERLGLAGLGSRGRDSAAAGVERVVLETCHRVEVVSVGDVADATDVGEVVVGREAVRRVLEVAGGFDSAVVAEEQLLGQVRGAYQAALEAGATGPLLNELFRRAIRFGRRVRAHALPGTDRSLADPGVTWLRDRLEPGAAVLVAGTGEMGRLVAGRLAAAGHPVTIASRSDERATRLLQALPVAGRGEHAVIGGDLTPEVLARHAGVVLAVRRSAPLLEASSLPPGHQPWTLDLSVPPAADAAVAAELGERYVDVDRLGSASTGVPVLTPAAERRLRGELETEVDRFVAWLAARDGAGALEALHGEADAIRRRHLDRMRRRVPLTDDQLAAVEAATATMLGELLHRPSVALRRGGPDAEAIRRVFGVEG